MQKPKGKTGCRSEHKDQTVLNHISSVERLGEGSLNGAVANKVTGSEQGLAAINIAFEHVCS